MKSPREKVWGGKTFGGRKTFSNYRYADPQEDPYNTRRCADLALQMIEAQRKKWREERDKDGEAGDGDAEERRDQAVKAQEAKFLYRRGMARAEQADFQEAVEDLKKAALLQPQDKPGGGSTLQSEINVKLGIPSI